MCKRLRNTVEKIRSSNPNSLVSVSLRNYTSDNQVECGHRETNSKNTREINYYKKIKLSHLNILIYMVKLCKNTYFPFFT